MERPLTKESKPLDRLMRLACVVMAVLLLSLLVSPSFVRAESGQDELVQQESAQLEAAPVESEAEAVQEETEEGAPEEVEATTEASEEANGAEAAQADADQKDAVPEEEEAIEVSSWRALQEALLLAQPDSGQVVIRVTSQFSREKGDPDLVVTGGDVILYLEGYSLDPRVDGQPEGNGRIITVKSATLTIKGEGDDSLASFTGGSADLGGAILVEDGTLRVEDCDFEENAAEKGGAIAVVRSICEITGGWLHDNTATSGGAIYFEKGQLTMSDVQLSDNSATTAGGVYVIGGTATMSGVELYSNSATTGGGAYVGEGGTLDLAKGAALFANAATENGGNIAIDEDGDAKVNVNTGSSIREGTAVNGGGVAVLQGKLLLYGGTISGNTASCGAGVAILGGRATVNGGTIRENRGSMMGGGVFVGAGALDVWEGAIESNHVEAAATSQSIVAEGGGVYLATGGTFTLMGSPSITSNTRGDTSQDVYLEAGTAIKVSWSFSPTKPVQVDVADLPELDQTREIVKEGPYSVNAFACEAPDCEIVYEEFDHGRSHRALIKRVQVHDGVRVTSWADLAQRLRALKKNEEAHFWLESDLKYGTGLPTVFATKALEVRKSANVTIDLNGHSIDRGLGSQAAPDGEDSQRCFYVSRGSLTIRDSGGDGKLCGGCCQRGGGVFVAEGKLVLEGGSITGNKATYGGGVYIGMGTFDLVDGRIYDNAALAQAMPSGGGVYVGDNNAKLPPVPSEDDDDDDDYGPIVVTKATMTMLGGSIDSNKSNGWGAGVCVSNGIFTLQEGSIDGNGQVDGASQGGGGLYAAGGSGITVAGGTISNNNLNKSEGAGISIRDNSQAVLSGGTISRNTSETDGGGISVEAADLELCGTTISDNLAKESGGGMVMLDGSNCIIRSGSFQKNQSRSHGGAVMIYYGAQCTMVDGEVTDNEAGQTHPREIEGEELPNVVQQDEADELGDSSSGRGGGFNVRGKLIVSGGAITKNASEMGSGICLDGSNWPRQKAQVVLTGSPSIRANVPRGSNPNRVCDINIYMNNSKDESALITIQGRFDPPEPVTIEKFDRNGYEYTALVGEGDFDMSAFKSAQCNYNDGQTRVLVRRDGILYAYCHEHTWKAIKDGVRPERIVLNCLNSACVYAHNPAAFTLSVKGLGKDASYIRFDGNPHEAYFEKPNVPVDLEYTEDFIYYEGDSTQGDLLEGAPSKPGTYTVLAVLNAANSEFAVVSKTYVIKQTSSEVGDEEEVNKGGSGESSAKNQDSQGKASAGSGSSKSSSSTGGAASAAKLPKTSDVPTGGAFACLVAGCLALIAARGVRRTGN